MSFHGTVRNPQFASNFLAGQAVGNETGDLPFAYGEFVFCRWAHIGFAVAPYGQVVWSFRGQRPPLGFGPEYLATLRLHEALISIVGCLEHLLVTTVANGLEVGETRVELQH